jgi:hypothetical protein
VTSFFAHLCLWLDGIESIHGNEGEQQQDSDDASNDLQGFPWSDAISQKAARGIPNNWFMMGRGVEG